MTKNNGFHARKVVISCILTIGALFAATAVGCAPTANESSLDSSEPTSDLVAYHAALGKDIETCDGTEDASGINIPGYYNKNVETCATATREYCMTCHADTWERDVAALENYEEYGGYNPHDSHMGELDCGTCHSLHGESTYLCGTCHTNYEAPDGWK